MATNNHITNAIISQVNIGNNLYDIHDANAVHSIADLGLQGALVFKGAVASVSSLPSTGSVGDVYHVVDVDSEYIWVQDDSPSVTGHWEEFGSKLMIEHTHTIPSLSGSIGSDGQAAAQKWSQTKGEVSGTAAAQKWTQGTSTVAITGTNSTSEVTGSGSVSVPKVTAAAKYAKVSTNKDTFVKSYPGSTQKLNTTTITGVSGSTTASKATAGTGVAVATTGTTITNIAKRASSQTTVGNADVGSETTVATGVTGGSAAEWSASVDNGVLSFSFTPNTLQSASTTKITPAAASTTKIYGCGSTTNITPAVSNGTIIPYTFTDVDVPIANTAVTTVATGGISASGGGSSVMVGLGTPTTADALTVASLAAATSTSDGIFTGDDVSTSSETKTVNITGTAAAQAWTQASGEVVVTGSNASSSVTGTATVTGTNAVSKVTGSISTNVSSTQGPK